MSQLSIWEIPEIALLSRDRRGVEGDETLPMEQVGEIRAETNKKKRNGEENREEKLCTGNYVIYLLL